MRTILVSGGAGYIGSHTVRALSVLGGTSPDGHRSAKVPGTSLFALFSTFISSQVKVV